MSQFARILAFLLIFAASVSAADERKRTFDLGLRYTLLAPSGEMGTLVDGRILRESY